MKRLTLFTILLLLWLGTLTSASQTHETLHYKVLYKWGLINKTAGSATLTIAPSGQNLRAVLTATSAPWADKVYKLRDTLVSVIDPATLQPKFYERIAHEDGKYARDRVIFTRNGENVTGECVRQRRKNAKSEMTHSETVLHSLGPTVDMVSAFYYLRSLDFAAMQPGSTTTVTIFSGKKKELLRFSFHGSKTIEINGMKRPTYHVSFTFTTEGSKKSSDDIETWLDTEAPHVPLKLQGKLPIGKIQCFLTQ